MENNIIYPIYRKLGNNRSFYKVLNNRQFEEIQVIGSKIHHYFHTAKQYPEILFIQDLISYTHLGIFEFSELEWENLNK